MLFWQQRGIIFGLHTYTWRYQTWEKQTKSNQSFVGLCNFFQTQIKFFAIIAAPLFKLTRKDWLQRWPVTNYPLPLLRMFSAFYKIHSHRNLSWPFPERIVNMLSLILHSCWKQQGLYGACISSMNISKEKNSSSLQIINLKRKWDIFTPKWWITSRQHCWNMTLLSNTRKVPSCQQIIFPGFHLPIQTPLPNNWVFWSFSTRPSRPPESWLKSTKHESLSRQQSVATKCC